MARQRPLHTVSLLFLAGVLAAGLAFSAVGQVADQPTAESNPFAEQLADAQRQLQSGGPKLEEQIRGVVEQLKTLEGQLREGQTPELIASYEDLVRRRDALQAQLAQLQAWPQVYQDAGDAGRRAAADGRELEILKDTFKRTGDSQYRDGDPGMLEARLLQQRGVQKLAQDQDAVRAQRLEQIEKEYKKADAIRRAALEQERSTLLAYQETQSLRRSATEARLALLQARLDVARRRNQASSRPAPETQSAPSSEAATMEAENKRKLANEFAEETRNRLSYASQQKADLQKRIEEGVANGKDVSGLENSFQYWKETEEYENRGLRQARSKKQEAQLKQQIIGLESRIEQANRALEHTKSNVDDLAVRQRRELAGKYRANAEEAMREADRLEGDARRTLGWIAPVEQTLLVIDADQKAIERQLTTRLSLDSYQRLKTHYDRMKRVYDAERQQIDQMVTVQTVLYYQNLRQAQLKRDLAKIYGDTAEVLVPTKQPWFRRYQEVIRAIGIFLIMIVAGYVTKLVVWLMKFTAMRVKAIWPTAGFSVKRVTTLASFAASISRLFIWIFGIIAILVEFGVNPATSSGAIGLISLVLAGMFQQIVVDFIKGLDIAAGRHYNVGDFVELDGKYGHVIDFSVKYTRIRTPAGEELNIANSRCIPSRRFPDGFVDNYVDVVLREGADVGAAKEAINHVALDLNQRLEPIKERPKFIGRFRTIGGRPVVRYRVRVLPGCDWVLNDYFIPQAKSALQAKDIGLVGEPKYFLINRIDTFRKLFSRQLSEQEILQEAAEIEVPTVERAAESPTGGQHAPNSEKPPVPSDGGGSVDNKPSLPDEVAGRSE